MQKKKKKYFEKHLNENKIIKYKHVQVFDKFSQAYRVED